ncbi:MAG: hypothetical protein KJ732_02790 [Candidatus Margulisbacteria bacterium]|nr:hypothetical protein [Candidatus Margulisiibacteriota bacterium]
MNHQHQGLSAERWAKLTLYQQMANIGSEVGRALNWRTKGNEEYSRLAFYRSLELLDLTLEVDRKPSHLKEMTRLRECLVDYFAGGNQYDSSATSWKKYFHPFNFAARASR